MKDNDFEGLGFSVDTSLVENEPDTVEKVEKKNWLQEVVDWLDVVVVAFAIVSIVFSFVFRVATIDGASMNNTLKDGQVVIISNLGYTPKCGDIVVISRNVENTAEAQNEANTPIIKRVIAVGRQTVNIDYTTGEVFVDGKLLDEPYISTPTTNKGSVEMPIYVPEGCVFVMGDNRLGSLDSRDKRIGENGIIDNRYILGHAIFRFLPFSEMGRLDNK